MKRFACIYLSVLLVFSSFLAAQQANKMRLLITDTGDNGVATIDTILPAGTDVDIVLKKLGYDQSSIAKASAGGKRQISIATEEILEMPSKFSREGMPFNSTEGTVTLDLSPKVTDTNQLKIEDIVTIPPGATVEDLPDGGKRILTTEKDAFGNTYTKQTIVRMGKRESVADGGYTNNWVQMDGKPIPPAAESLRWDTQSYLNSSGAYPNVQVTIADCDMFDLSTLNSRDKTLINAEPLAVSGFMVKPDFKEGYFRFTFNLPTAEAAEMYVYDVIGAELYRETVSGAYSKLIPEFNLYRKGTFLVLLRQGNKKFTQKLVLD